MSPHLLAVMFGLCALLQTARCHAEEDPWFGEDKAKHFGASAVLAIGGYTLGAVVFDDRSSSLALGGGIALSAGIGKEIYDAAGYGTASERDLVWDLAGTATGLGLAWLFDRVVLDGTEQNDTSSSSRASAAVTGRSVGVCLRF